MNNSAIPASNHAYHELSLLGYLALTTLLGVATVTAVGVDASRTVAIQCITGRSFDKYLSFSGSVQLEDRYAGMKLAFGADNEIFTPERVGTAMHHPPLSTADYDALITSADRKSRTQPDTWLSDRSRLPLWTWLYSTYGCAAFVCASFAFLPVVIIASARWVTGASWISAVMHAALFVLLSAYDGALLDIRRQVSYIRVKQSSVSPKIRLIWNRLYGGASTGPPSRASHAVHELASGVVRKRGDELLIPVIALKPSVEFNTATWWFMFTNFRTPLLATLSSLILNAHHYLVAVAFTVFAQTHFHNGLARAFCTVAAPQNVIWFRRLPSHSYMEELAEYRRDLH